jgi:GNAT superfamily N-acetyltransferase
MKEFTQKERTLSIKERVVPASGLRFTVEVEGREVGRAYLYILKNDLHEQPFGLLEDVFIDHESRKLGLGNRLIRAILMEAHNQNCYKVIATSRNDGSRDVVHAWYERCGFKSYGTEFRMDF